MRIAINASHRLQVGGGLVRLERLLDAWSRTGILSEHPVTVLTRREDVVALERWRATSLEVIAVGERPLAVPVKAAWEQFALPGVLKRLRPDVLLCPGNIAPLRSPVPTVVMFQNALPFCPRMTPGAIGWYDWLWARAVGFLMRRSARSATRVIFISHYFKDMFVRRFGFPPNKGDVMYHGRDDLNPIPTETSRVAGIELDKPYLLSVSHLRPYKNIPALIDGYAGSRLSDRGIRLVLAGSPRSPKYERGLRSQIRRYGLDDWVLLPGSVPHEAVGFLLANCEAFVFQSPCENCPNALIEAVVAGVPIACSRAGVMPEIAGQAAVYFDPYDPANIAGVLRRVVEDDQLRDELRNKSVTEALKFPTWEEVGSQTFESLAKALHLD